MTKLILVIWIASTMVAGAWVGLNLPDIDQRIDFLLHRSALTHGPLVPLIGYLLVQNARSLSFRLFPMFLCLGYVVHLSFDLFPKGWSGYALISLPVYGWLPPLLSIVWIAASVILCAYLAARLARGVMGFALLVTGTIGIFVYAAPKEAVLTGPLLAVAVAIAVGAMAGVWRSSKPHLTW